MNSDVALGHLRTVTDVVVFLFLIAVLCLYKTCVYHFNVCNCGLSVLINECYCYYIVSYHGYIYSAPITKYSISAVHTERVVNIWNCLPGDTVDFSSLSAFERSVKRVDLSDFLKFT